MASTYTIFATYILEPTGTTLGYGYGKAIHCNYIRSAQLDTDNIIAEEIKITFSTGSTGTEAGFKFLSDNVASGTGYTAHKIYALVQVISGSTNTPIPANWKLYDITNQVTGYTTGSTFMLTPAKLRSVAFKIPLHDYSLPNIFIPYNLNYLNYPSSSAVNALGFGYETYFMGNVNTEIHADVYTTNLSVNLPLNEFNSTTNLTWSGLSSVAISEIGIYDLNKNLVAVGKLNDPLEKNDSLSRTIAFAIDF